MIPFASSHKDCSKTWKLKILRKLCFQVYSRYFILFLISWCVCVLKMDLFNWMQYLRWQRKTTDPLEFDLQTWVLMTKFEWSTKSVKTESEYALTWTLVEFQAPTLGCDPSNRGFKLCIWPTQVSVLTYINTTPICTCMHVYKHAHTHTKAKNINKK